MRSTGKTALAMLGGAAFALTAYLLLALPGLLSDRDSTVPNQTKGEARR